MTDTVPLIEQVNAAVQGELEEGEIVLYLDPHCSSDTCPLVWLITGRRSILYDTSLGYSLGSISIH